MTPTVYQTNIYSPNWVLGNQTINDLVNTYIQRSKDADNITNCPIATPFFDGTECIACDENEVFNMEKSECLSCPNGTKFDQNARNCVDNTTYISGLNTDQIWVTGEDNLTNVID